MKKQTRNYLLSFFVLVIFVGGFLIGKYQFIDEFVNAESDFEQAVSDEKFQLFWEVWNTLETKYAFDEPSTEDKIYGAISGLVESYGDPYTTFLAPAKAKSFIEDVSGQFYGVGMEVGDRDGFLTVVAPLKGSPAQKAGIKAGDTILKIDGVSTEGFTPTDATRLIRGRKGEPVTLSIFREDEGLPKEITIIRDLIHIPIIDTEERDGVFIISLYSFAKTSFKEFENAMENFKRSKGNKLIIDLRNNPGGYLDQAVDIAGLFLDSGKIVVRETYGDEDKTIVHRTNKEKLVKNNDEIIILTNGGSASASEILAGALQEYEVAKLIGEPTFGKGSVQELVGLSNNSSIKITVAKWLTPGGVEIGKTGLTPDIQIEEKIIENEESDNLLELAIKFLNK